VFSGTLRVFCFGCFSGFRGVWVGIIRFPWVLGVAIVYDSGRVLWLFVDFGETLWFL